MLIQELRPKRLKDLVGNSLNKELIRAIVRDPKNTPSTIIMEGSYGSGKTSSARLLARALNCEHFDGDLCGKCAACTADLNRTSFYVEYDSSVVGNADAIKDLRDTFYYQVPNGIRVVVFDEAHLFSKTAMSALLKVFEEAPENIKFILCSTDGDKILPTIRSRSLELSFKTQSTSDVSKSLLEVSEKLGKPIDQDIADLIAIRSGGHMRNAHMMLDQYYMIGKEGFTQTVRSSVDDVLRLLVHLRTRKKESYLQAVDTLLTYPLSDLIVDYQKTLLGCLRAQLGLDDNPKMVKVASLYGKDLVKVVRICSANWLLDSFTNDILLQTALLALYQMFAPQEAASTDVNRNAK